MEFRTILLDTFGTTDKVMVRCNECDTVTITYQYKNKDTINKSVLFCKNCTTELTNLEELAKKPEKRLLFHSNKG